MGGSALLAGCAGALTWNPQRQNRASPGGTYTVQRGDTLASIASHYGLDYHQLAAWNDIQAPYRIYPGEHLRLVPSAGSRHAGATTRPHHSSASAKVKATASAKVKAPTSSSPAASPDRSIQWSWPVHGRLLSTFEQSGALAEGIDIGGSIGEAIRAAASGKVVYTGSGLIGYGKLIIIKHDAHYLSAYAHNQQIFVTQGEQVKKGKRIATMGTDRNHHPMLHFEIRYNGNPVNPLHYLPSKSQ
jgi:lipoprotein NlpD